MAATINFGIDLGTTNSLIARTHNGNIDIFKNPSGMKVTLPSVVAFRKDRILIGDKAREYVEKDPSNVFSSFKRKMGTSESFFVPNNSGFKTPVELSTLILQELKNFIFTGEHPASVVITIPASFDTIQSNATKEAGYGAGFKEVLLLQEPIAASLAFANKEGKGGLDGQWLVYDLGGGTFDVALVRIEDDEMKVVDHEGDNFFGGIDFDQMIVTKLFVPYLESNYTMKGLADKMLSANGKYNKLYFQLLYKAEEAKIGLSSHAAVDVEFEFEDEDGQVQEVFFQLSRQQFDEVIRERIARSIAFIRSLLQRNTLEPSQIAEIVLVGGSTYIPLVRTMLAEDLTIAVNTSIDPTTAVVEGAAYYAGSKPSRLSETRVGIAGAGGAAGGAEGGAMDSGAPSANVAGPNGAGIEVKTAYQMNSREHEEYFAASIRNAPAGAKYRIIREDGGFDSGLKPVGDRVSEMLTLISNCMNVFQMKLYDGQGFPLALSIPDITIVQGVFSIYGQPLPNDICLEVDDADTGNTKLEVIFERNTILPIRKSVTKTLSRTIVKGSEDQLLINVLEGSRYSSPQTNLPIGIVSITGKDLTTDLIKGADVELSFEISESRDITVKAYISMIDKEYKEAFNPSSRTINIVRLQQEVEYLYNTGKQRLEKLVEKQLFEESAVLREALTELEQVREKLKKLQQDDVTDTKYQLDDQKRKLAKVIDTAGQDGRIRVLKEEYFDKKAYYKALLEESGNKDLLQQMAGQEAGEQEWLQQCSSQFLQMKISELDHKVWSIQRRNFGFLTNLYTHYAMLPLERFKSPEEIKVLRKRGDDALQRGNPDELLAIISKMHDQLIDKGKMETMKGTGLRG